MNWSVLGKISGIVLTGGGFGAASWFFWPTPLPDTKNIHVYVISQSVSSDNATKEINININRNFRCRVKSSTELIPCEILEPRSFDDLSVGQFKVNPTKIKRDELKNENNIYVLQFDEQHQDKVTSKSNPQQQAPEIEIVSTQEENKKYASLKVFTALTPAGQSKNSVIKAVMSNTKDINKSQKHLATIAEDKNKIAVANKIFDGCEDPEQKTKARCSNVSQSLDILINKLGKQTDLNDSNSTNSYIRALVNADNKKVAVLFDVLNVLETSKNSSTKLSSMTFGLSNKAIDLFSGWYTWWTIKGIESATSRAAK